jgi:hypothetical protein
MYSSLSRTKLLRISESTLFQPLAFTLQNSGPIECVKINKFAAVRTLPGLLQKFLEEQARTRIKMNYPTAHPSHLVHVVRKRIQVDKACTNLFSSRTPFWTCVSSAFRTTGSKCRLDDNEGPHLLHTRHLKLVHIDERFAIRYRTERALQPLRRHSLGKSGLA